MKCSLFYLHLKFSHLVNGCCAWLIVSMLSTITLASEAQFPETIIISAEEYPPFTTTQLKHNGLMSHIVTEAFILENITVEYRFLSAARSLLTARDGQVDGTLPWAMRADRNIDFYYSDPILDVGEEHFFFKKNSAINWEPIKRDYSKLKGLKVGVIIAYDYGDRFQKAKNNKVFEFIEIRSLNQLFKMLLADRIDVVISKELVAEYTLENEFTSYEQNQITSLPEIIAAPSYDYLLLSKKRPSAEYFLNALNRGLKKLHLSGRYDELIDNYSKGEYLLDLPN